MGKDLFWFKKKDLKDYYSGLDAACFRMPCLCWTLLLLVKIWAKNCLFIYENNTFLREIIVSFTRIFDQECTVYTVDSV